MKDDVLETLAVWGERTNRETALLLDLAMAGVIDQLRGYGRVVIKPARLEEIADRIAPRQRDEEGGWIVELKRPDLSLEAIMLDERHMDDLRTATMQASNRWNMLANVKQFLDDDDLDGAKAYLEEIGLG